MRQRMTRRLIVAACLTSGLLTPSLAESATLLQWMFPRAAARRAARRTAYSPWTTTYYSPTACNTCNQTTAYYGGGCSTCSSQQTGWYYRPQTQYRTVWSQVPVTSYRPVTTAYAVTQPCTSYSWQARRVPYVTYRPMFAGVDNSCNSCNSGSGIAPNAGTYWTQFGSAGFRLPTTKGPAPCTSCTAAPGLSTPADVAPVLTPPATTSYSIPSAQTSYPTTTAGYPSAWTPVESSQTVQMPNAADWQPVQSTTSGYAPAASSYSYSGGNATSQTNDLGATPWMPVDEFNREFNRDVNRDTNQLQPVPADKRPQLEDSNYDSRDRGSYYERNNEGSRDEDARWRSYNQYGDNQRPTSNRDYLNGPTSGVNLDRYLSVPSGSENRNAPRVRPIPDYDRHDFESKTEYKQPRMIDLPEITASLDNASAGRWVAEPLRPVAVDRRSTQVQRPNADVDTLHREGGWRAVR